MGGDISVRVKDCHKQSFLVANLWIPGYFWLAFRSVYFCCPVYSWISELTCYSGGPAGTVYGYLIAWIGSMTVVVTLSELASM